MEALVVGRTQRRRQGGSYLFIAGAVLLVISLFLGWYTISEMESAGPAFDTVTLNLLPGPDARLTATCSGYATCPPDSNNATPYANGSRASQPLATLYESLEYVLISAILVGLVAGGLGLAVGGRRQSLVKPVVTVALVALAIATAAPALVTAGTTSAWRTLTGSSSGPGSSFIGSNSTDGVSANWGPGYGFLFGVLGAGCFLGGALLWFLGRRQIPVSERRVVPGLPGGF